VTRGVGAALLAWSALATGWVVFLYSGRVSSCLGPIGVTPAQCRAANGLPPGTDLDRFLAGPGLLVVILAIGWIVIVGLGRWRRRQRGGL